MADFSNSLSDPVEAARRRYGFSTPEDLGALDRLVALAAGERGGATLSLGDRGGRWYEAAHGVMAGPVAETRLFLEGAEVEGLLQVAGPAPEIVAAHAAALILQLLTLRRLIAERRRQPRGPEGASFVPGVVHELRNFLFAMGAGLDAFAARFGGEGEEAGHAEALRRNLTRLQTFLDELHEYGNPGGLTFALVPVMPVLAQGLQLAKPLAEGHGIRVALHAPDIALLERMDRAALEGSLRRLIELAVLETDRGEVRVTAQVIEGPGRPWLEVAIGGRPSRGRDLDPNRLFEPFYYRDKEMSRLGPAVARRIIEAHGGQLAAATEEGGLMLRLLLPVWMPGAMPIAGEARP
ncbi:MAG TPA: HAMP domain-containing sensor histidine kinase [Holophagaceae bacterium]|jgi:signal transduction histidine kinase|nr:HAMP domain-containing sensor histidine kinase [Holophagaceae bacterium]